MPSQALRARHRSVSQESVHQAERASSSKYQQSVRAFPYILILSVLLLPFVQATNAKQYSDRVISIGGFATASSVLKSRSNNKDSGSKDSKTD